MLFCDSLEKNIGSQIYQSFMASVLCHTRSLPHSEIIFFNFIFFPSALLLFFMFKSEPLELSVLSSERSGSVSFRNWTWLLATYLLVALQSGFRLISPLEFFSPRSPPP